jgi:cold shock protein
MATGRVKRFNRIKGFGFITPDDGGKDVYFEFQCLAADDRPHFSEGERVEFDPVEGCESPGLKNIKRR